MAKAKVKQQSDETQIRDAMKAASNASRALANTQVDLLKFTDDGKLDPTEKARLRAGNKQVFQHLGAFDALIADGADAARLQRHADIAQEINDTLSITQATLLIKLARGMSRKDLAYETDHVWFVLGIIPASDMGQYAAQCLDNHNDGTPYPRNLTADGQRTPMDYALRQDV